MKLAWQQIPSTVISEILCQNSLQGVVLDTEHAAFNNETLFACIQVLTLSNKKAFVRLTEINKTMIRMCLDAGATGLIFSTVETAEQAKEIHKLSNYPINKGTRGLGLVRENNWGISGDLVKKEKPVLIAQIETIKGVEDIQSISKYDFDYFMIGPYDLSASLDVPGEFDNEKYVSAVRQVKKVIPVEKMAVHIPNNVENELKKYENYGMIALGMDTTFIIEKCKELEKYA